MKGGEKGFVRIESKMAFNWKGWQALGDLKAGLDMFQLVHVWDMWIFECDWVPKLWELQTSTCSLNGDFGYLVCLYQGLILFCHLLLGTLLGTKDCQIMLWCLFVKETYQEKVMITKQEGPKCFDSIECKIVC
jgi:hypothetical protein